MKFKTIQQVSTEINMSDLEKGTYTYQLYQADELIDSGTFIKQ